MREKLTRERWGGGGEEKQSERMRRRTFPRKKKEKKKKRTSPWAREGLLVPSIAASSSTGRRWKRSVRSCECLRPPAEPKRGEREREKR